MKKWQIMGVLTILIIVTILMSGCISTEQVSTPTVKNDDTTIPVTGSSLFIAGDIISIPGNTFNNGDLILGYDSERDNYQYVFAWKGDDGNWTFRSNSQMEVITKNRTELEHYEKLANIMSSSIKPIPTMYQTIPNTTNPGAGNICNEWIECGFGFGNLQGEPAGLSQRCHELYEMRMQNDQRVMSCLKNPYEASGDNAVGKLHCMQGVGTVEECAKYGIKLDRDNGNVMN